MDTRHISFVNLPHSPHVNPTLPVAAALVRRGYRVTYITSDRFSSAVEAVGAEVILCRRLEVDSVEERNYNQSDPEEEVFARYTASVLQQIMPFFREHTPDLLLYDFMALAGRILAKQLSIPAIQTSPFYAFDEAASFESQVNHGEFRKYMAEHAAIMAQFLQRHGVASNSYRVDKERLNIYLFPRVLQPKAERFGSNCYFAGRCAAERVPPGRWERHTDGRPVALIGMSTLLATATGEVKIPEYFKMCIQTLPGLGWHVVMAIGERCNPGLLSPLPAHCEIVNHASYLKVLPHASLLIFMSGVASTAEAAYQGVPMIAMSEGNGEYEWQADHLVELGIGAHIRKADSSDENIARAAVTLSSDVATQYRVREVQRMVRREPGGEETANRIEDYLDECGQGVPAHGTVAVLAKDGRAGIVAHRAGSVDQTI